MRERERGGGREREREREREGEGEGGREGGREVKERPDVFHLALENCGIPTMNYCKYSPMLLLCQYG